MAQENQDIGNIRETFFLNQLRVQHVVSSSSLADFKIDTMDFEIGGKNKGNKQIVDAQNGFVVWRFFLIPIKNPDAFETSGWY